MTEKTERPERDGDGQPEAGNARLSAQDCGSDTAGAELHLDRFLPYRLSVLSNLVSQALAEQYQARFGLSIPQWRVMANLGRTAPMSANEVAERTSMDKVKVSRAIASMQALDLLTRETDPRDNRMVSLKLSAKGRRIYEGIAPMALAWEQEFLSVLNDREIAALDEILVILDKRIRE
jgi:DNA-binding MarR family transcriptional regulator